VPIPGQAQGNGLTVVDAAVHMPPGQNMQVAGNILGLHKTLNFCVVLPRQKLAGGMVDFISLYGR